ncbi:MAG TPA: hypothetical protein VKI19_03475 [Acidimicrobiales bacterium]|nr:hypothetical protein [Acidimicrobiales bacterium]
MDIPPVLTPLLAEIATLTAPRIASLADSFTHAESCSVQSTRRAVARHLALTPDTPGVISVLAGQLALSDAMLSLEAMYELDQETAYAARAAVLDMGLVMCADSMPTSGAEALAAPWLAATY